MEYYKFDLEFGVMFICLVEYCSVMVDLDIYERGVNGGCCNLLGFGECLLYSINVVKFE